MTRLAAAERAALCDLLETVGPEAPTLCEGWTAYDLAVHLAVRDRDHLAALGAVVPALADRTARAAREFKDTHSFAEAIELVRSGPPAWGPVGLPLLGDQLNLFEYVIHYADVHRAQPGWQPREVPAELNDAIWSRLRVVGRMLYRNAPVGVQAERGDGTSITLRKGISPVTLVGEPIEVALFGFNRRYAATLEFRGSSAAIARLHTAHLGI
ncbi:MAG TPA: TIGR03085 family metal-binding protein [Mycobacteriales bacterium]|nr:TIGR03085 family metal-binding protein [Mycobacteriales bacterium]